MNNCDLIKKFSQEFIKMIDATKDDGNERSVNFCPTNGDIELSDICIGDKCSVPTVSEIECKDNRTAVGNMHTHPGLGVEYGILSDNDIMHSVAKGKKFACIGYRGIAKTINCFDYPYGIPKEEADKFKNLNYFARERKLGNELKKYGVNIVSSIYIRKSGTNKEHWQKLTEDANFLTEAKDKFKKYISSKTQENCTIFLAPLD